MVRPDPFAARTVLETPAGPLVYYSLERLEKSGVASGLSRLPFSIKILLEAVLRNCDGFAVTEEDVSRLSRWDAAAPAQVELPFVPARVILQDFTGVPVLVDLAAMRAAVARLGGDPRRINPLVPVDLVIDHSVQVDYHGTPDALLRNVRTEFERNRERYEFLRWGQNAVQGFRVVPPSTGIVHQVNLEYLAQGVLCGRDPAEPTARACFPDTVVGTDSHTTMINGLGVLGWGVGGIEAEAVMLGQPLFMLTPQVVGVRLSGHLREGVTATDLVLTVTQLLRKHGVVDKFVEFCGPGLAALPLADRATIANMAPEYGATIGFFPTDATTLDYLRRTGRNPETVALCERYCRIQGLFRTDEMPEPIFSELVELDLSSIEPSLAGPKRPQDRVPLREVKRSFQAALRAPTRERGFGLSEEQIGRTAQASLDGQPITLRHGSVVIAAITSCTNTSNPSVMIGAGLLAQKAVAAGLRVPAHVKTSLAPGSQVVTEYLREAGLLRPLEQLGFFLAGYGCTTCIGNSGPLPEAIEAAVAQGDLVVAAVLSGNRNFEGRIHAAVRANYLASPPLVVAYALAGTVDIDLEHEPVGYGPNGRPVYLRDIWPSQQEIAEVVQRSITPAMFEKVYARIHEGPPEWQAIRGVSGDLYAFDEKSTYIQEPPFFAGMTLEPPPLLPIRGARVLCLLGDSVTTDHISPAGSIAPDSPAGQYLLAHGVSPADFNSYGARRGNHQVMVRGTFANIRLKNLLVPGVEGGVTLHLPSGEQMTIFAAAERYRQEGVPLLIVAGKEYGTGSSRDWAAKGPLLLGVRAVLAESFERIHRANLVGMGVLPLMFRPGENAESLGLTGRERYDVLLPDKLAPRQPVPVRAIAEDGSVREFVVLSRLDTPVDVRYYEQGGILQTVLRDLMKKP
ncbi:MAG: aconitate hydratase AcnA, partial [Myxococcota bacterium]|nr:aconitate hydratase AcnA [Myxococcota bacterium]